MLAGNRKFVVSLSVLVLSFVLAVLGRLGGEFVTIAVACVGAFAASNAFEHHTKAKS
jgi:hypothetical protein